jgi:hypothetical protein
MSRLDEIKARYDWCERCANHDPRDRRDHGHLRSQTEIDALWLVDQVEWFGRWKAEALEMIDNALAEVVRLTAERDALAAAHARESEKVWKVEEVMDDIEGSDPTTWERLRAAIAGSEADTSDTQPTDQEDQS